jgi:hypothetical protein
VKPATTIEDAAYKSLANFNRNVWEDEDSEWWTFEGAYVDRAKAPEGDLKNSFRAIERRLLKEDGATKIMFTGQTGCGKSMELRRLAEEPEIKQRFELIEFSLLDRLNDAVDNDLNHVLLTTASVLADHIVGSELHGIGRWDKTTQATVPLKRWLSLLTLGRSPDVPERFDQLTVKVKAALAEASLRLRSESELRRQVSTFEARELQELVSMFLVWIGDASERKPLLIVDDADKLYTPVSIDSIFRRGLRTLTDLPAKMVLTFPLNVLFDDGFGPPANLHVERLFNVKVIHRQTPDSVIPEAVAFFREILDPLVDPKAELFEAGVVEAAVRLSAGVPREFIRLLKLACEEADLLGRPKVSKREFEAAVANYLRRELVPRTQLGPTPRALMRVRLTKKVSEPSDLKLLHANLVVDYANEAGWQDANPVLTRFVDELLEERRALLRLDGLSGPALEKKLREQLERGKDES